MINFLYYFVKGLLWLWIMLSATSIIFGTLMIAIYYFNHITINHIAIAIIPSVIFGVYMAEKVRKKYGLINLMGRLLSHPEIDGPHRKYKEK